MFHCHFKEVADLNKLANKRGWQVLQHEFVGVVYLELSDKSVVGCVGHIGDIGNYKLHVTFLILTCLRTLNSVFADVSFDVFRPLSKCISDLPIETYLKFHLYLFYVDIAKLIVAKDPCSDIFSNKILILVKESLNTGRRLVKTDLAKDFFVVGIPLDLVSGRVYD